jgi:hypothetical protein
VLNELLSTSPVNVAQLFVSTHLVALLERIDEPLAMFTVKTILTAGICPSEQVLIVLFKMFFCC